MTQPLTRRATAVYRSAEPHQLEAGALWYPSAHELAHQQADDHHVTVEVAAGVIAALSPRLGWGANLRLAERMLASGGTLDRGALSRSLGQARAVMECGRPLDVLSGPKVRAFYDAILTAGESDLAVIDRHAWDMLTGKRLAPSPTLRQYREASEKMQRAGRILGASTSHVQAVTWVAWRARYWSASAFAA